MYRRIRELVARIEAFNDDLWALMPEQYRDKAQAVSNRGPICDAWRSSLSYAIEVQRRLEELASLIAAKIPPAPVPDANVGSDVLIEVDGEKLTLHEWAALYNNPEQLIRDRVARGEDWESAIVRPASMDRPDQQDKQEL